MCSTSHTPQHKYSFVAYETHEQSCVAHFTHLNTNNRIQTICKYWAYTGNMRKRKCVKSQRIAHTLVSHTPYTTWKHVKSQRISHTPWNTHRYLPPRSEASDEWLLHNPVSAQNILFLHSCSTHEPHVSVCQCPQQNALRIKVRVRVYLVFAYEQLVFCEIVVCLVFPWCLSRSIYLQANRCLPCIGQHLD